MKVIKLNKKKGFAKIYVNTLDDLWRLSKIVEKEDWISARSERKIKIGREDERQKVSKKSVYLTIKVKKINFKSARLRLTGEVIKGPKEISLKSTHTISISEDTEFKIQKTKWSAFQIEQLKNAEKESLSPKALICALDDEQANLGYLTGSGIKNAGNIHLGLTKKMFEQKKTNKLKKLANEVVDKSKKVDKIIIASPSFWKQSLLSKIEQKSPELKKKIILADVSTGSKRAFHEIVSKNIIDKVIKDSRAAKNEELIEKLLRTISNNIHKSAYGIKETKEAARAGALKFLLVHEELLNKDKKEFREIKKIIEQTESTKSKVHILDKKSEAGKKLLGLGGIGGVLRYRIN